MNPNTEMEKSVKIQIFRYIPDQDPDPYYQEYEVPFRKEWVILDAINYIKDHIDTTLSYRWSCRMGVCGSCGMMINDKPVLTCETFMEQYLPGPIRIAPLNYFDVIRDLVVETNGFMEKVKRVKPWIIRDKEKPPSEGEYLQTPDELAEYKQYSMCINCMLCYSACPVVGLEPKFIGPAAVALAQRYNFDSRDEGKNQRDDELLTDDGIYECTLVGECSEVCPKKVDPAGAIQRYKVSGATQWWTSVLLPFGKK
jgi:fumarate reductase iron-sulfur subunit